MMTADTQRRLKTHVERIVRPIRATEKDKLKMREELYAHAIDVYADEHAHGEAEAAVERTLARLGDPHATRVELQSTVNWQSRWGDWVDRFQRRPAGRPVLAHAGEMALKSSVLFAIYSGALILPLHWANFLQWNFEGRLTLWFLLMLNLLMSTGMFLGAVLGAGGRRLAERRYASRGDYARAAGLVLAGAASICLLGWCFTFAVSFDTSASSNVLVWWAYLSAPVSLGVLIVPYLDVQERRPLEEWLTLDITQATTD